MLKAIGNRVLIEIPQEEWLQKNGLFVASKKVRREMWKTKDKPTIDVQTWDLHILEGLVVSVGSTVAEDIQEGDTVYFNRHNGHEFDYEKKHYIALEDTFVSACTHCRTELSTEEEPSHESVSKV